MIPHVRENQRKLCEWWSWHIFSTGAFIKRAALEQRLCSGSSRVTTPSHLPTKRNRALKKTLGVSFSKHNTLRFRLTVWNWPVTGVYGLLPATSGEAFHWRQLSCLGYLDALKIYSIYKINMSCDFIHLSIYPTEGKLSEGWHDNLSKYVYLWIIQLEKRKRLKTLIIRLTAIDSTNSSITLVYHGQTVYHNQSLCSAC